MKSIVYTILFAFLVYLNYFTHYGVYRVYQLTNELNKLKKIKRKLNGTKIFLSEIRSQVLSESIDADLIESRMRFVHSDTLDDDQTFHWKDSTGEKFNVYDC